ncbi:GNAT family N-acetyltransferase [Qipengyuania sphaerica]|uniref:GNAT family N-acetyltransferase n=1 Tax=Qipengyuania sphaerica TaxID=2867243 RepID=UPI001C879B74|nr:GNAT family N-acetyltransferase [Qipengyuania sphaerica]MBX7539965.1 GNAT family N-acetyltransferase [Qipengyuania sphaerica]
MIEVRPMTRGDEPRALELMRALARFEGYLEDFAVTEGDLAAALASANPPFRCRLAWSDGVAVGIAVTYRIDWTFDLRPTLVLKELFVEHEARGSGAGAALFAAVEAEARRIGASRIRWLVLAGNDKAKSFYRSMGGRVLGEWEQWELPLG